MDQHRTLTTCPAAEADVLVGALRAEGFDAWLQRDGLGRIYGLTSGAFATEVRVSAADYAAARRFLDDVSESGTGDRR